MVLKCSQNKTVNIVHQNGSDSRHLSCSHTKTNNMQRCLATHTPTNRDEIPESSLSKRKNKGEKEKE